MLSKEDLNLLMRFGCNTGIPMTSKFLALASGYSKTTIDSYRCGRLPINKNRRNLYQVLAFYNVAVSLMYKEIANIHIPEKNTLRIYHAKPCDKCFVKFVRLVANRIGGHISNEGLDEIINLHLRASNDNADLWLTPEDISYWNAILTHNHEVH